MPDGKHIKFEKWALIAESVGTIAIVATLIVLVFRVRESTEATRIANFGAVTQSLDDWRSDMLDNPELFERYYNYKNGVTPSAEHDGVKHAMLLATLISMFTNVDRAYLAYQNSVDSDEWSRIRRGLCSDRAELLSANDDLLRDRVSGFLTSEFLAYMEADCD